jgi:cytoskeletal protein CcmA (bactofilin family)
MFKSKNNQALGKTVECFETFIGASIRVDGNILLRNSIRIDGIVNGDILQEDGCEASVAIALGAIVRGDIRAKHVIVSGSLYGNIFSPDRVELLTTAFVSGDIIYGTLGMEVGARLHGKLNHVEGDAANKKSDDLTAQVMLKSDSI